MLLSKLLELIFRTPHKRDERDFEPAPWAHGLRMGHWPRTGRGRRWDEPSQSIAMSNMDTLPYFPTGCPEMMAPLITCIERKTKRDLFCHFLLTAYLLIKSPHRISFAAASQLQVSSSSSVEIMYQVERTFSMRAASDIAGTILSTWSWTGLAFLPAKTSFCHLPV